MRVITRRVAFERQWDAADAERVSALFDSMADGWTASHDLPDRYAPLVDALDRSAIGGGVCVELGSGTGLATRHLQERFDSVTAMDLAFDMLRAAPAELAARVQADSSRLPLPDESVDVLVLVNMLLFPLEVERVLRHEGAMVWVNTVGESTPIHLSAREVHDALPGSWNVTHSRAGAGIWAVARRSL